MQMSPSRFAQNVPGYFTIKVLQFSHTSSYLSETLHIHRCHLVDTRRSTTRVNAITMTFLFHFKDGGRKKDWLVFSLYFFLPDLLFSILYSIHISTNFKVFPFKWYQEYAYPCFRADLGMSFRRKWGLRS